MVTRALGLLLLLSAAAHADEPWKPINVKDTVTYEKRAVPGSSYYEYRASFTVTAQPPAVVEAMWQAVTGATPPTVKKREVLKRSANEMLIYDQLHARVVSDRDVTLRLQRVPAPDGGGEIRFDTANELGPPPAAGFVRLPVVRGAWTAKAVPGGGTALTYVCYSEPGGSVPAFMVRGGQQDKIVEAVERMLGTLRKLP
jgi:hypothetical protein